MTTFLKQKKLKIHSTANTQKTKKKRLKITVTLSLEVILSSSTSVPYLLTDISGNVYVILNTLTNPFHIEKGKKSQIIRSNSTKVFVWSKHNKNRLKQI